MQVVFYSSANKSKYMGIRDATSDLGPLDRPGIHIHHYGTNEEELMLFDINILVLAFIHYTKTCMETAAANDTLMIQNPNLKNTLTVPPILDILWNSKNMWLETLAASLEDSRYLHSPKMIKTLKHVCTNTQKFSYSPQLVNTFIHKLQHEITAQNCRVVSHTEGWTQIKEEALGSMWNKVEQLAPEDLANMNSEGTTTEDNKGVDGEDLGVLTIARRACVEYNGHKIVLVTADAHLCSAAVRVLGTEFPSSFSADYCKTNPTKNNIVTSHGTETKNLVMTRYKHYKEIRLPNCHKNRNNTLKNKIL